MIGVVRQLLELVHERVKAKPRKLPRSASLTIYGAPPAHPKRRRKAEAGRPSDTP